jgi:hypothetical protein
VNAESEAAQVEKVSYAVAKDLLKNHGGALHVESS